MGSKEVDVYGQLLIYKKMLQNVVSNINKIIFLNLIITERLL